MKRMITAIAGIKWMIAAIAVAVAGLALAFLMLGNNSEAAAVDIADAHGMARTAGMTDVTNLPTITQEFHWMTAVPQNIGASANAAVFTALSPAAPAPDPGAFGGGSFIPYITTANLNLREAPSTEAASQGILPNGSRVYVIAFTSSEWFRVETPASAITVDGDPIGGRIGYMAAEFLIPAPTAAQDLRIGVTSPSYDNVGLVLNNIRGGVAFDVLTNSDLSNFDRLSQYHAIFINCGSHQGVNTQVLRRFVQEGGVVYASDLAATTVRPAFPDMFSFSTNTSSQTVQSAAIVHTSLASHMGRSHMDINFNLSNWAVITELSPSATVYIRGNVSNHGVRPLAFSFDYGRGRVFFTSFHNHVQATTDMVNFIEYLIFRIQHFEAEGVLVAMADDAGYVFDGAVFGILDANEVSDPFFYTPAANDFMLLFDPDMGDFTITLSCPDGNLFSSENVGILTDLDVAMEDLHLAFEGFPVELITTEMVVESLGDHGFRVLNPISGEWSFWVQSNNVEPDTLFAVGLAERPTAALTRAMFTQVLANLDGVDLSAYANVPPSFYDVAPGEWFFAPVEWTVRHGITEGIGRNRFAPNSPLTRQQMVTMLYNYTEFRALSLPIVRTEPIPDYSDISSWARNPVLTMYHAGIISMQPSGYFYPRETSTTPEIAYVFENLLPFLYHVEYIHESVFDVERFFPPSADDLGGVSTMADAHEAIVEMITTLTPQQRQYGEGLNLVALYMENIMRRGTSQHMGDGNISAAMLQGGVTAARHIHNDIGGILEDGDVALMRSLRTNINFESEDVGEISAAFPDDVSGIAFDNLTIEADFAAITIARDYIPVDSSITVRRIESEDSLGEVLGVFVEGPVRIESQHGRTANSAWFRWASASPTRLSGTAANPTRFGGMLDALLDFSSPLGILLNFWSLIVIFIMLAIWLIVAIAGEQLRKWVVPTFVLVALVANIGMIVLRHHVWAERTQDDYVVIATTDYEQNEPEIVDGRVFHSDIMEVTMTPGMRITLSMPVNGHDPEFLVVVNENDEIQHSRYNPVTGTIDARIRTSGTYTLRENEVTFADIADRSQQMQDAIRQLASRGIMQGAAEGYFYPDAPISRTDLVTTIVMAFDMLDFDAQSTFTDVEPSAWYYLAVATAQQAQLIDGFADGTFRGHINIPKDQLVVMTANMLMERMGYLVPSDVEYFLARFLDREQLRSWSEDGIALATASNVLIHRTDSLFAPRSTMTRGDAAIVLYRVFSRVW